MMHRLIRTAAVAAASVAGLGALAASAPAAVAPFERCPLSGPDDLCVVVTSNDGSIAANGHRLPLAGAGLKIEGGLDGNTLDFVAPTDGRPALSAKPVDVPGGLFGTALPYNLNSVKATIEQVGPISYGYFTSTVTAPVRVRFSNPLLGAHCVIGSSASPIVLTLIRGTTSPPPPNAPVSGTLGRAETPPGMLFATLGQVQVDNTFAVPAATGCGIVAGQQVTKAINNNLGLPSAAGHYNDASLTLDHYVALANP